MRTNKTVLKKQIQLPEKLDLYLHIPEPIYSDERTSWMDKILWCKIHQLDQKDGCFASNKYLSEIMGRGTKWTSKKISKLKKMDYLYQESFNGRKRILRCTIPSKLEKQPGRRGPSSLAEEGHAGSILPIYSNSNKINKDISHGKNSMGALSKISYKQKHFNLSCKLLNLQSKIRPKMIRNITPAMKINGAIEIERLERIDKYNFKEEIKPAILWGVHDPFWGRNIISAASVRNKGKNGLTKFNNMFNSFLEFIDTPLSSKSDVPAKDKKIIDMIQKDYHPFTDTQLLLTIPKMRKAYKETKTAPDELTDFITFVWEYIKYLKKQEWITDPHPLLFRPDGKVWSKFIDDLKENKMVM